ncbi:MAG: HD-GYP domain-containing protein [Clostridia bacterium]|nr:HD-GYP domain-containing protein [Clostridia bacterium]
MQLVAVDELRNGMVLAQDVISDTFVNIVSESTVVTNEIVEKLMNLGIDFVYVQSEMVSPEENTLYKTEPKFDRTDSNEALNYNFNKTVNKIKNIFNDLKFGVADIKKEMDGTLEPLLDGILINNDILKNLRLMKYDDDYTLKHSVNVGLLSAMIGKWIGLTKKEIADLSLAGTLHDVGKSKVPRYIINKPGELSAQEYGIAQLHAQYSYEILSESHGFSVEICNAVKYHHERFNGSGYPEGLKGKTIPLYARIIAVADVFDALTADKVYQRKISPFLAADIIKNMSFGELDPEITNIFLKKISEFYVGNKVLLNTGEEGEIVYLNKFDITKPLVKVNEKFLDLATKSDIQIKEVL